MYYTTKDCVNLSEVKTLFRFFCLFIYIIYVIFLQAKEKSGTFAVRKLPHKKCMANLKTEDQGRFINDDAYSFLAMKNSASGLDLMIPNNKLYEIGILCYAAFEQKFRHFLYLPVA